MYEVYLEIAEGWGVLEKNPFHGVGMDMFWNYTLHADVGALTSCEKYYYYFYLRNMFQGWRLFPGLQSFYGNTCSTVHNMCCIL